MRKYVYENATVYISEPTEAQIANIRAATERFAHQLMKKGMIDSGYERRHNRRASVSDTNAGRRNKKIE